MRRTVVFALAAVVLLLVLLGGYSAFWLITAGRIRDGFVQWAQSAQARKFELTWRELRVGGFPFRFLVVIDSARLRDNALRPAPELRIPVLSAAARPWRLAVWQLAARDGFAADFAAAHGGPDLKFAARTAHGTVMLDADGAAKLWLSLEAPGGEAGARLRSDYGNAWILLPSKAPRTHTDPSLGLALDLHRVAAPLAPGGLGGDIDELAFAVTFKGTLPDGDIVPAVAAWRDAGGTIELDNLHLEWGGLAATATGTIALDEDLQPIGGFSGAIQGYDRVLAALVAAGNLRARDAGLARLALALLAKAGPNGRPQIATSFTIEHGEMFLGPAKLGRAPRISWH
jgi:hypothetical protein